MLTFFRRIRKGLLGKGAASKYLLYAIGEILLVMIGILLALQINNWNKDREIDQLELSTLNEIKYALVQDTVKLNQNIKEHTQRIEHTDILLNHIAQNLPYTSYLDTLFSLAYRPFYFYSYNTSAFDLLKERGMDIISNETLRRKIGGHYTGDHAIIKGFIEKFLSLHTVEATRIYPYFQTLHEPGQDMRLHPLNYESLRLRKDVINVFYHFKSINVALTTYLGNFSENTHELLEGINKELTRLQS